MSDAPQASEPQPPRSRSYSLKRREEVSEGLRRVAAGRASKAIEALGESGPEDSAEAIHSARKDIKKLRSVLRLCRGQLGEETCRAEHERYREAGRALASSRDAAVKVETLAALEDRFGTEMPSASAWAWRRQLSRERDEAASGDADPRRIEAARGAIAAGLPAIERWPLEGDSWKLIGPGLARSYRRGRTAMAAASADPDPELVHAWRKRAKDLWYQLRLIRAAWPEQLEPTIDASHRLSELLGDHHDLAVLAADLGGREGIGSRVQMGRLIERRQAELLENALELGVQIYAEKPKAFRGRIRTYWSAWR